MGAEQLVEAIRGSVRDYHAALDRREHGGVAASKLVEDVERLLDMPWSESRALGTLPTARAADEP